MKLEFDSIGELEQFLMFTAHIGKAFAQAPAPAGAMAPEKVVPAYDSPEGAAFVEAAHAAPEPMSTPAEEWTGTNAAPKRKRRTKAEMEAERAAETQVAGDSGQLAIDATAALARAADLPSGNPFAVAPSMQAILDAPNHHAGNLAAHAALQVADLPPAAEPRIVESLDHLRACQAFIQKHGMTKYNESFVDGLNANIAAYSPEQRAQHVAVLEVLAI